MEKALEKQFLLREAEELREKTEQLERRLEVAEARPALIFKSKPMQEIDELINAMAPSDANALIVGESGVGKEVIANAIHARSRRAEKPMVKLNCAAFPQTMIEGELFSYVKGAFTGAMQDFPGMIAAADSGTLFLDEISDMPAELQTRFLRELQNAIEYAVVLARQGMIGVKELPTEIQLPPALQQAEIAGLPRMGVQSLDDVERTAIIQALAECHGNKKKAAELLGIQRPTLYNKMKRYAIEL